MCPLIDRNGSFAISLAFNSEPSQPAPLFIGDPKLEPHSRKVEEGRSPSRIVTLLGRVDAALGVVQAAFCFHNRPHHDELALRERLKTGVSALRCVK